MQSIEGMLRQQDGIRSVKVALLAERGVVEYDPAVWNPDKIAEVRIPFVLPILALNTAQEISDIGFDATHIPPSSADPQTRFASQSERPSIFSRSTE